MKKVDREINCPQCGDILPIHFSFSKLAQCSSCGSHIFLEDESARLAGEQSVLSLEPSLVQMHKSFAYGDKVYTVLGHIRYGVGRNVWDEWWITDRNSNGYWLSVDDGDYIIEKELKFTLSIYSMKDLTLDKEIDGWLVTEIGEGRCLGFEGELPEIVEVGEVHHFAHLSRDNGKMMTVEIFSKTKKLYRGRWLDPYDIREALL